MYATLPADHMLLLERSAVKHIVEGKIESEEVAMCVAA